MKIALLLALTFFACCEKVEHEYATVTEVKKCMSDGGGFFGNGVLCIIETDKTEAPIIVGLVAKGMKLRKDPFGNWRVWGRNK